MPENVNSTVTANEFINNIKVVASSIAEGVIIADADESIVWVNKALEEICGYPLEKLKGMKPSVLQGEGTDKKVVASIRETLNKHEIVNVELVNYKPDGTPYWIKLTVTPILNEKKEVVNFVAFEHDISEEKRKEAELKESEKLYKRLFVKNPGVMFIFDPVTYRILEANETALKTYGYTKEEFLNLTIMDIRPPEDREKVKLVLLKAHDEFMPRGIWRHLKKNGEIMQMDIKATGILYKGKQATLIIPTDMTEQLNIQTLIEQQMKNVNIILQSITDPFYIIDRNYNLLFINEVSVKLSGFKKDEIIGKNIWDIFKDQDFTLEKSEYAKALTENKASHFETEYFGRTFLVNLYPSEIGLAVSARDITEIKKNQNEILEKAKFIQEISDNTPGGIMQVIFYPDGKSDVTFLSEGFRELWGFPVDEAIKDPAKRHAAIHPDDLERVKAVIEHSVKNAVKANHKFRYINQETKEIKWVRASVVPTKHDDGTIIFNGVFIDITESEKYYSELEKSNQRYEYVSKAANESIWDLDLRTNQFTFGGSYKEMFGYSFPGNTCDYSQIAPMIHPEDAPRVFKGIDAVLKDSTKRYWEDYYRVIRKGGGIVYVYDRGYVIYDNKTNKAVRFVGATQNITQRKLDEEALTEQIRKVNVIIEGMSDPFFVLGKNLEVLLINKAALMLTKLNSTEIVGKNIYDVNFHEAHTNMFDLFRKSIKEQKAFQHEFNIKGKWYDVLLYPSEIGLAVYAKDITGKKMRQEEMQRTAKFIKEISDSMAGFVFQTEYNPQGIARLKYASENAFNYWGVSVAEVMEDNSKLLDSIHPDDITEVVNKRLEAVRNLTNMDMKFRYVNKITGDVKWVSAAAIPTRLENGNTLVNGVIIDINDSQNYYNKLEEANLRYEHISKATNNTIWELDLNKKECVMGGAYENMYGYKFENDILPDEIHDTIIHPDDLERVKNSKKNILTDNSKRYWEEEYRVLKSDGSVIHVYDRAYVVYDKKTHKPLKILGSSQDVTQLKKTQEERNNMIDDLVKRNKALEQFTYMVSHNLRAPIANILGISYLLEDNTLDDETKIEMNGLIKKSSSRLDEVIKDMNEILSIKKNFEDKSEIKFKTMLNEIISEEKSLIEKSNIKIISDFKQAESIYSIKSYLYSIFQNLITNSIKYRNDRNNIEPFVKISSSEDKDFVYLNFEDNGIGIDLKKNGDKIFGLYNRFHLNKEGKGMGLFMVKSQLESLNGEISVESKVNTGSKFSIKIKK